MSDGLTTAALREGIKRIGTKIEACADELNRLDGSLGDGDLGVTMVRGARSLSDELPNLPDDVGMALLKCAQVLTKVSGSTIGTLLATGLLTAAKKTKGPTVVPWQEISSLLAEAVNAMSRRGRSHLAIKPCLTLSKQRGWPLMGLTIPAKWPKRPMMPSRMLWTNFAISSPVREEPVSLATKASGLTIPAWSLLNASLKAFELQHIEAGKPLEQVCTETSANHPYSKEVVQNGDSARYIAGNVSPDGLYP